MSGLQFQSLGWENVHVSDGSLVVLKNLPLLLKAAAFLIVLRYLVTAVYNLCFHPLSKYPGPKHAAISSLPYWIATFRGQLVWWILTQHERYGEVVRLGPDRLSYTKPQAWKDIYGHRTGGRKENPKDTRFYIGEINGENGLITVKDVGEHGRLRKVFSNAFSDRALKLQESLISKYADQLVGNISRAVDGDPDVRLDMAKLFNCATFDIVGDLSFGEPLGLLQQSEFTPWVKAVFGNIKTADLQRVGLEYPLLGATIRWLMPKSLRDMQKLHFQQSASRVDKRLQRGVDKDKPDIWNLVLEKGRDQLTLGQMHANASVFMIAGTETTATLLSGLTYQFLKNPAKLQKAAAEVRELAEDELTLERLPRLQYLAACFEEGLRVYPPTPLGSPREVAEGGNVICGDWIPGKTRVALPQFAANRSPLNFKDPNCFVPERWLPGTGYDDDRKEVLNPFAFGPRNCIGKNLAYHEMRVIMAKVLWHFDLELCPQSVDWGKKQQLFSLWQKPALLCRARPVRGAAVAE